MKDKERSELLYETVLDAWIEETKVNPSPDLEAFIESRHLTPAQASEAKELLKSAYEAKEYFHALKVSSGFKAKVLDFIEQKYETLYGKKAAPAAQQSQMTPSLLQPLLQGAFRKGNEGLTSKDKELIERFNIKIKKGDK